MNAQNHLFAARRRVASWVAATLLTASGVYAQTVTFFGEDNPNGFTTFFNDSASQDVLLVRFVESNQFYVLPPGQSAMVHATGRVEGSVPMESFTANLLGSETGVAYRVDKVANMERSTSKDGPWTNIAVGDLLTSCMWYQRKTHNTSQMDVTDVATGAKLSMPLRDDIYVIVPHHVPWDPRFENVNGYDNFADFGYADLDITGDSGAVSDTSAYKADAAQMGLRGSYGEAVVPQRRADSGGPSCSDISKLAGRCKRNGGIVGKVVLFTEAFDGQSVSVSINGGAPISATISGNRARFSSCCHFGSNTIELTDPPGCGRTKTVRCP